MNPTETRRGETHPDVTMFDRWLAGEPMPAAAEAHVRACPECRETWEALQRAHAFLRRAPQVAAPADLYRHVLDRLPREDRRPALVWLLPLVAAWLVVWMAAWGISRMSVLWATPFGRTVLAAGEATLGLARTLAAIWTSVLHAVFWAPWGILLSVTGFLVVVVWLALLRYGCRVAVATYSR